MWQGRWEVPVAPTPLSLPLISTDSCETHTIPTSYYPRTLTPKPPSLLLLVCGQIKFFQTKTSFTRSVMTLLSRTVPWAPQRSPDGTKLTTGEGVTPHSCHAVLACWCSFNTTQRTLPTDHCMNDHTVLLASLTSGAQLGSPTSLQLWNA